MSPIISFHSICRRLISIFINDSDMTRSRKIDIIAMCMISLWLEWDRGRFVIKVRRENVWGGAYSFQVLHTHGHRGSRAAIRRVACQSLPRFVSLLRVRAIPSSCCNGEKCVSVCAYEAFKNELSGRFAIPFPFDASLVLILSCNSTPSFLQSVLNATRCDW